MFGKQCARTAVAVGAVLALATACSHGDAAQPAETPSSQAAPAPVAPAPAPAPAPPSTLPPVAPNPYDFGTVSTLIDDAIAANKLPGAVVQIGHGGQVVFRKAYGERKLAGEPGLDASPAPAEPMTEDTIFDLASLTKPLATAPAVMQLYEQGKVQFDDPVQKYLPDFNPTNDPVRAEVTVRMLLTHTSGETGDVELKDPWGLAQVDREEGFRRALTTPLESAPGAGFRYSDINFILLGLIVEKLTGAAEDDYVQQNIFAPLGMTETRYLPAAKACGPHSMRGAAIAWSLQQRGSRLLSALRHLEHESVVAHRTDSAGRGKPSGAGQESRHRLPAAGRGERHDGAADGRGGRACRGVLDGTRCRHLRPGAAGPVGGSAERVSVDAGDAAVDDNSAAARAQRGDRSKRRTRPSGKRKPNTTDPLLAPHYPAIRGQNLRGFGWDIDTGQSVPRGRVFPIGSFGHTGFTGTSVWIDPGSDTYVVLLTNSIHTRGSPPASKLRGDVATAAAQALGL